MGKIKVLTLVLTKLDIELGLAQPQLVSDIYRTLLSGVSMSISTKVKKYRSNTVLHTINHKRANT